MKKTNIELLSYSPKKFETQLEFDHITFEELMWALQVDVNRDRIFKAGEGTGKSGSFFFFSHDNRFIIKTMRGAEKETILNMLDAYIEHIRASNNKSLLARIYGVFTIKTKELTPIDLMIM